MKRNRLDKEMHKKGLVVSRSQAENLIQLRQVKVNGQTITKSAYMVSKDDNIELLKKEKYVSRAAYKLESVATKLNINFDDKTVLDVGSSTGGFTDYALRHGAKKVIAVDVGTDQLHPSLHSDQRIDLREKTDIRDINEELKVDIVLIDVSFISLKEVLPHIKKITLFSSPQIVAMCKPQFEAGEKQKNKGVVKNDKMRRQILKDFESWSRKHFVIEDKADSEVAGSKGNVERFYLLKSLEV